MLAPAGGGHATWPPPWFAPEGTRGLPPRQRGQPGPVLVPADPVLDSAAQQLSGPPDRKAVFCVSGQSPPRRLAARGDLPQRPAAHTRPTFMTKPRRAAPAEGEPLKAPHPAARPTGCSHSSCIPRPRSMCTTHTCSWCCCTRGTALCWGSGAPTNHMGRAASSAIRLLHIIGGVTASPFQAWTWPPACCQ